MKKIIYIFLLSMLAFNITSCDESKWLKEKPMDIYTPENSYNTAVQFRQALNFLYNNYREFRWNSDEDLRCTLYVGDIAHGGYDYPDLKYNNYSGWITATTYIPSDVWNYFYKIIGNANQIIYQLGVADQISEDEKKTIKGEAQFFRALAYNYLANLYGGVPLNLEPVAEPKRDFVRATREEVYNQCRIDLEESALLLGDISEVKDGMLNKQAALHLLTEVNVSLGRYQDAINTASQVIDHPDIALMTERFGSRANEPGDVYWDLFRVGNQNRATSINRESIWVLQYEYQNAGSSYPCQLGRQLIPGYWSASVEKKDGSGNVPAFTTWTAEKGGRGIGSIQPTNYFFNELWGADFDNDIRNSAVNIIRDFRIDNPEAKGFGEWIVKDGWLKESDKIRIIFPAIQKFSRTNNYPEESYRKNADGSQMLTALGEHALLNSGTLSCGSYKDEYAMRLAETYLLRAEAYLGAGLKDKAADDINTIRKRAHATPVDPSDVDIDYILDERMRELYFEEIRIFTTARLGKTVERAKKYNPTAYNMGAHQNLWPIPYGEIEKNIFSKIEQNPGY